MSIAERERKPENLYAPLLERSLHLAKRFVGFAFVFVAFAMCLALGDCYGWVPHGWWYNKRTQPDEWAQEQFEECQRKCTRDAQAVCVKACSEAYATLVGEGVGPAPAVPVSAASDSTVVSTPQPAPPETADSKASGADG